ncbi:MAG: ROK family protein [Pedosphaera sp.]|nr:ROK family protein [Pedosphaera sp.]
MSDVFASIDLGGTNMHAPFARCDGSLVAEIKQPTRSHEGPEAVVGRMIAMIRSLAEQSAVKPVALGIGVPGLVDVGTGTTRFLPNMPTQWRGIEMRAMMEQALGFPAHELNDARTATLGELVFGHGQSVRDMAFFTLGTGVGGGVVLDGRLRLGPLNAAGELGHQTVDPHGLPCSCGSQGCLETVASGPALAAEGVRLLLSGNASRLHELCEGDLNHVTTAMIDQAAREGDTMLLSAIERMGAWIGIAAANILSALHPQLIVLGGGVAQLGDLLLDPVRRTLHARVGMFPTEDVEVRASQLGDKAGLLGGIALAWRGAEFVPQLSIVS